MTKSQIEAIERIKRLAMERYSNYAETHEIKELEVRDYDYFVSVVIETGLKDDEGTLAEFIARDRAHLFIGKRGGITYPVTVNGKMIRRRFKGYSILQAVCDQRI